jgi:TRAP-type transport system periplasmic protein
MRMSENKSRPVITALMIALLLLFSGYKQVNGQSAAGKTITLKMSDNQPLSSEMVQCEIKFGEMLKERTQGRIVLKIYPGSMLGSPLDVAQELKIGVIDMLRVDPALRSILIFMGAKSMQVLGLPYLFTSIEHAHKMAYGSMGQKFLDDITKSGANMVGVGYIIEAPRNLFLKNRKITRMSQAKGLKIRAPENKIIVETLAAFGISTIQISMAEAYNALKTDLVDGAENSLDIFKVNRFNETCKYITLTGHLYGIYPIVFSKGSWNKLKAEDQALIISTWREAAQLYDREAAKKYQEIVEAIKNDGVQILNVENPQEWQDSVKPLYEKYGKGYESLIDGIRNIK